MRAHTWSGQPSEQFDTSPQQTGARSPRQDGVNALGVLATAAAEGSQGPNAVPVQVGHEETGRWHDASALYCVNAPIAVEQSFPVNVAFPAQVMIANAPTFQGSKLATMPPTLPPTVAAIGTSLADYWWHPPAPPAAADLTAPPTAPPELSSTYSAPDVLCGAPSGISSQQQTIGKLHRPCATCRTAKVLCNRELPCARCRRLNIGHLCKAPPTVQRGRPSHHSRLLQLRNLHPDKDSNQKGDLKPNDEQQPGAEQSPAPHPPDDFVAKADESPEMELRAASSNAHVDGSSPSMSNPQTTTLAVDNSTWHWSQNDGQRGLAPAAHGSADPMATVSVPAVSCKPLLICGMCSDSLHAASPCIR